MSKDSDAALSMEYRINLINKNKSLDSCKECASAHFVNDELLCSQVSPTVENCNLLKLFYTS